MSTVRVRIYAQVGTSSLLNPLADAEVSGQAEVPELLRKIADEYEQGIVKPPGIPSE